MKKKAIVDKSTETQENYILRSGVRGAMLL